MKTIHIVTCVACFAVITQGACGGAAEGGAAGDECTADEGEGRASQLRANQAHVPRKVRWRSVHAARDPP